MFQRIMDVYNFPLMLNNLGFDVNTSGLRRILPLLNFFGENGAILRESMLKTINAVESNK